MSAATPTERQEELVRLVRAHGYLSIAQLAEHFAVTEMTIRRDVSALSRIGAIRRVHGGASAMADGTPFPTRAEANTSAKRAIAMAAAKLVEPAAILALDSGSTLALMPAALPAGADLTVATHSVPAIRTLADREDVNLIGLGGAFHRRTRSFFGPQTRAAIGQLNIDILFLAASGITDDGVHCGTPHDAETKQALIARARRVILLADSTKFGQTAAVRTTDLDTLDAVVTDSGLPETWVELLQRRNIDLVVA